VSSPSDPQTAVRQVVDDFALGEPFSIKPLGGTATAKFEVRAPSGRFVVRRRPAEFAAAEMIRFDHESLGRLADAGLPVPRPLARPDGTTWTQSGDGRYEVLSWVEGGEFHEGDRRAVANVGRFLARFHAALAENIPPGKEGFLREDHPDLLAEYVPRIRRLCKTRAQEQGVDFLAHQLELVRENLDRRLWPQLPTAVIHGDVHPGNLKFRDSDVSAIFDFDYLSPQARVRDVVDGLAFFASVRDRVFDTDDIRLLVQPFRPDAELSRVLLCGYEEVNRLEDVEWEALPWLIRSLWIQMRLRGSRKVPSEERAAFVLDRFEEVIAWLEGEAGKFVASLRSGRKAKS
jgi:Ser/Thr protein kinase RdoA (MazF antagonist)